MLNGCHMDAPTLLTGAQVYFNLGSCTVNVLQAPRYLNPALDALRHIITEAYKNHHKQIARSRPPLCNSKVNK